jgi:hypothetical protein
LVVAVVDIQLISVVVGIFSPALAGGELLHTKIIGL